MPETSGQQARLSGLKITLKHCDTLRPSPRNARTHTRGQIEKIARSIETFGWTNPVLVDADNTIIAGHGRVEAAKLLGLDAVPTIRLEHMTPEQVRAYVIADNKLAELAGWDDEILALEFEALLDLDLGFDLEITGFEAPEIDLIVMGGDEEPEDDPADDVPDIDHDAEPVTRPGDLWLLGCHRLYCGDATMPGSFDAVLEGRIADLVFTDPPYNVPVPGHVSGKGRVRHRDFAMASGEMSTPEFQAFLRISLGHAVGHSRDGAIHFVCMDWRHVLDLLTVGGELYAELKNICVWNKTNGGMGSLYRSKHELVAVFKNGTAAHVNNVDLGRYGRNRTNVWDYAGVNSFSATRSDDLADHPTVKPVRMVADAILDCSRRGDIVLDPFAGSGSTILAAERTGRCACAIELDPVYVDVALRRFERETGVQPVRANEHSKEPSGEVAGSNANLKGGHHG